MSNEIWVNIPEVPCLRCGGRLVIVEDNNRDGIAVEFEDALVFPMKCTKCGALHAAVLQPFGVLITEPDERQREILKSVISRVKGGNLRRKRTDTFRFN